MCMISSQKQRATIPIVDPTTNGFRLQIGGPDNDIDEVSISGFVIGTHSHTNHQTKLGIEMERKKNSELARLQKSWVRP